MGSPHLGQEVSTPDEKGPPRTRCVHPGQEMSTLDERSPQHYGSRETGPTQSPRSSSLIWTGRGEVTLELKSELLGPNANLNNSILDQATQGHNQHQEQEVLPCQRRHKRLEREVLECQRRHRRVQQKQMQEQIEVDDHRGYEVKFVSNKDSTN